MRSYIFTDRERKIVTGLLIGEGVSRVDVAKIMFRYRRFTTLASDVELYLALRKFAESEVTDSA
ncbi:hypothetical protein GWN65_00385 [Candidatus Bathyarchaeota archaeon]|nr:hypothetical protein [Candidatus Bathyarchaeota archaeon]NIV43385.1 hypothetical protein [Candidatus Bathyarchaeota archaeon]